MYCSYDLISLCFYLFILNSHCRVLYVEEASSGARHFDVHTLRQGDILRVATIEISEAARADERGDIFGREESKGGMNERPPSRPPSIKRNVSDKQLAQKLEQMQYLKEDQYQASGENPQRLEPFQQAQGPDPFFQYAKSLSGDQLSAGKLFQLEGGNQQPLPSPSLNSDDFTQLMLRQEQLWMQEQKLPLNPFEESVKAELKNFGVTISDDNTRKLCKTNSTIDGCINYYFENVRLYEESNQPDALNNLRGPGPGPGPDSLAARNPFSAVCGPINTAENSSQSSSVGGIVGLDPSLIGNKDANNLIDMGYAVNDVNRALLRGGDVYAALAFLNGG